MRALIKSAIANRSHGTWNGQRTREARASIKHILGNSLHLVTDAERAAEILKRYIIIVCRRKICAMDGIVVQMCKSSTIFESIAANGCHIFADGQRTREACTTFESRFAYRGHGIRNGQRARKASALMESHNTYGSHGIRDGQRACHAPAAEERGIAYRSQRIRED